MFPNDTTDPTPTKQCSKCKKFKPLECFNRDRTTQTGFRGRCRPCETEYVRAHRKANIDRLKARDHAYYVANKVRHNEQTRLWREANREYKAELGRVYYRANWDRIREYRRAHYAANKERKSEYGRKWNAANKERKTELVRKWRAANPEKTRAAIHRRRAYRLNAEGTQTAEDVQRQYKAQRGRCYYCHVFVGETYHLDHVIPLSRGGSNGMENLVISCPHCNQSKNDSLPSEWPQGNRLL